MVHFSDSTLGNAAVVAVSGRLDATSTSLFEGHCIGQLAGERRDLLLDFTELDYLSSAGLRSILTLGKKVKGGGGKLVLVGITGTVKEIFDITGFSSLFPMAATMRDAMSHVL